MHPTLSLFLAFITASLLALGLCRGMISVRLMDVPDSQRKRDAHKKAVPSSGGVGFIVASLIVFACLQPWVFIRSDILWMGFGVISAMFLGLFDDIWNVKPKLKLGLQIAIAVIVAMAGVHVTEIAPGFGKVRDVGMIAGIAFAISWMLLVTNAVNFMDGANGVSMGMAAFASLGFSAIAGFAGEWQLALAAAGLTGGLFGFLIWNVAGRLFAGDAGALAVGMALSGFSILLIKARPDFMWIPPILLSPFLVDVLLTLNYRFKRGDNFWEAHSLHVYQLGLKPPLSLKHWQVAIGHWMIAANCAALAFAAAMIGYEVPFAVFMGVTLLGCAMHTKIRRAAIAVGIIEPAVRPLSNEDLSERQIEQGEA